MTSLPAVILKIVLIILLILIIALLAVLFIPVRYRFRFACGNDSVREQLSADLLTKETNADIRISWLLKIFGLSAVKEAGKAMLVRFRFLFFSFPLKKTGKRRRKKKPSGSGSEKRKQKTDLKTRLSQFTDACGKMDDVSFGRLSKNAARRAGRFIRQILPKETVLDGYSCCWAFRKAWTEDGSGQALIRILKMPAAGCRGQEKEICSFSGQYGCSCGLSVIRISGPSESRLKVKIRIITPKKQRRQRRTTPRPEAMSDHKENRFQSIIESMMDNAQAVLSTKTVVGEPIKVDDTIIIPLSDVTIGCAAGSNNASEKDAGLGGLSAKISPTAVLVIRDKVTKVVSIKDQNTVNKLLEMVPDVIDRFALRKKGGMMDDDIAVELAFPEKASEDTE